MKHNFKNLLLFIVIFQTLSFPVWSVPQTSSKQQNQILSHQQNLNGSETMQNSSLLDPNMDTKTLNDANRIKLQQMMLNSSMLPMISVHILGDVLSPGVYPAKVSDRLSEVLIQAGSNRKNIRLVRLKRAVDDKEFTFDLYKYFYFGDLTQNPYLQEGDVIYVPNKRGAVRIDGAVNRAGEFELNNEKNIADLLHLAGGISSGGSDVLNIKVIRFADEGKKLVLDVPNVEKDLKDFKIQKGDIVIVPNIVTTDKKFDYSVETMPGEKPFYPTSTPEVVVMGQVNNPGPYPFKPQLTVKDYVAYAGPDFDAKLGRVTVMRDGKKMRMKFEENLESGDMIIVKRKMQFKEYISFTSSSLALVLSVLVLDDRLNN